MHIRKKILNILHPILKPLSGWYLSHTRSYIYKGIVVKIYPGVFHPGLFFSTKVLLNYLTLQNLKESWVLELGAGTGLISIYSAKNGAVVTASDINPSALLNIADNAETNNVKIKIVNSDLFDNLSAIDFNWIVINPPYYPKKALHEKELAWYCGENFEYFQKLFVQLKNIDLLRSKVIMILSEDCNLEKIHTLAKIERLTMDVIYQESISGEANYIYQVING